MSGRDLAEGGPRPSKNRGGGKNDGSKPMFKLLSHKSMNQKGQNVVEYALLVVAIMVVVIAFVGKGAFFRNSIEGIINDIPDSINRLNNEINLEGTVF